MLKSEPCPRRTGPKGYKVYTELDDGYYVILGSQDGAGTMRILLDHKA
jgi:hypothetical protein